MDHTSFPLPLPPHLEGAEGLLLQKIIFLFSKVKLVIICIAARVTVRDVVQPEEEILILTSCCPQPWRPCPRRRAPQFRYGPGQRQGLAARSPLTLSHGHRRKRWENYNFSKAQQFPRKKKKKTSEARYYYSTGLFCVSQEITSDCTKRFGSREVIQKPCLVSKFPNLKSHSWGNNIFQAKLKHAYNLSEGPRGKPEQKTKLMHIGLFQFHLKV